MLHLRLCIFSIILLITNTVQLFSQCPPGPSDTGSFLSLDATLQGFTIPNCFMGAFGSPPLGFSGELIESGQQFCIEFPAAGIAYFENCDSFDDNTVITIYDTSGNVIDSQGESCGFSTALSYIGEAGEIICVQIESTTNGVCDGINSIEPIYAIGITSQGFVTVEELFSDPIECQNIGFNDIQTINNDSGLLGMGILEDSTSFTFATGASSLGGGDYVSGMLTVCAQGNTDNTPRWQILTDDGDCIGDVGSISELECFDEQRCFSYNFDQVTVAAMVADGTVGFNLFNFGIIGDECENNLASVELTLCSENPLPEPTIPTLGEWGLICLSIILLCFGVVAIRQEAPILN